MEQLRPRAVIFDLDGTLLNTLDDLRTSVNLALEKYGLPQRSREDVRRFVGNGIPTLVRRAIPAGTPEDVYDKVLAEARAMYTLHSRDQTAPYPGILPMLEALAAKGIPMAVLSNKPDVHVKSLCAEMFGGYIGTCVGQREGVPLKPDPAPLLETIRAMGVPKEGCVYVGDSDVDVQTAQNAGLPCISVLWGFRDEEVLRQAGGTVFITNPAEMLRFF